MAIMKIETVSCIVLNCEKALIDLNLLSFCVAGGEVYQILWIAVPQVQCRSWEQVGRVSFRFVFWSLSSVLGVGSIAYIPWGEELFFF